MPIEIVISLFGFAILFPPSLAAAFLLYQQGRLYKAAIDSRERAVPLGESFPLPSPLPSSNGDKVGEPPPSPLSGLIYPGWPSDESVQRDPMKEELDSERYAELYLRSSRNSSEPEKES